MFPVWSLAKAAIPLGFKMLKYFVDSTFRDPVTPVPGSVLYCDLWVAVEHSGIHVGGGRIADISVDGMAESVVNLSTAESFTSKSTMGRKIYVSCDSRGAVGKPVVAKTADAAVGTRSFYGLVIKNCHQFSTKCVNRAHSHHQDNSLLNDVFATMTSVETWEPTMAALKRAARDKLGATKWRLWDWENEEENDEGGDQKDNAPFPEPDWQAHEDFFKNMPLNPESMAHIRAEFADAQAYEAEIADETLPDSIRQHIGSFRQTLTDISNKYEEVKGFLASCPCANYSYNELQACAQDFAALASLLQNNTPIKELARKMGRNYISEEKKKQTRIPQASKSEVYGTHRSDDLMRVLPSELLNLEDETLETLFYAKLLEKNLLSYELQGMTFIQGEETDITQKRTGPVVACLDTSGSMQGLPLLKAKALLLAIANILKKEDRSLHVVLFGSSGEIREFTMEEQNDSANLLKFLQQGFGGGTDFESPLNRAFKIIASQADYKKADVLMITDGDCGLSPQFAESIRQQKHILDCAVYTVLCNGQRVEDTFSDEVVVL